MSFAAQHNASNPLSTTICAPEAHNTLIETPQNSRSILFIDAGVDGIQTLVNGVV